MINEGDKDDMDSSERRIVRVLSAIEVELNELIGLYSKYEEIPKMPLYKMLGTVQWGLYGDSDTVPTEKAAELLEEVIERVS